jgi:hypothetical protein
MEILSPVWSSAKDGPVAKRRLRGLAGATVAIVDDNLDIPFTTRLEALLAERAGATVKRLVKPSGTAPSPPALLEEAARADVAVVGIGL